MERKRQRNGRLSASVKKRENELYRYFFKLNLTVPRRVITKFQFIFGGEDKSLVNDYEHFYFLT